MHIAWVKFFGVANVLQTAKNNNWQACSMLVDIKYLRIRQQNRIVCIKDRKVNRIFQLSAMIWDASN